MALAFLALSVCVAQAPVPNAALRAQVAAAAASHGLPPALADAVVTIESGYDTAAAGDAGEVGLMQILPSTAAMLGFRGTRAELADPATNLRLGTQYLAGAWQATGQDVCATLMKYRAGYGEDAMSARSVLYCRRAKAYLASIGSPLGAGAEALPFADIPGPRRRGRIPTLLTRAEFTRMRQGHRTEEDSRRYWAAQEQRIRHLRARQAANPAARAG